MEEAELSQMLDLCLRLAAENRITDKNVWALPLIDHLPDIVQTAAKGAAVNFGKMSSGLDAGVQIYSKRVEQTWKAAHNSLFGIDKKDSSKDGEARRGGICLFCRDYLLGRNQHACCMASAPAQRVPRKCSCMHFWCGTLFPACTTRGALSAQPPH
jgi:hypothetical protein